ncbi:MAG: hypothetical protein ACT4O1_10920 [Gemmatimonadota bacterium]
MSGEYADDWRFTEGATHEFRWGRWTSPRYGSEEAWTFRYTLNCVVHLNPDRVPFDTWIKRDILDSERQFRVSVRETFAGRAALRSSPIPGWENLDTLLFVEGNGCVYQFRIGGLEAERRSGGDMSLTALLSSLQIS